MDFREAGIGIAKAHIRSKIRNLELKQFWPDISGRTPLYTGGEKADEKQPAINGFSSTLGERSNVMCHLEYEIRKFDASMMLLDKDFFPRFQCDLKLSSLSLNQLRSLRREIVHRRATGQAAGRSINTWSHELHYGSILGTEELVNSEGAQRNNVLMPKVEHRGRSVSYRSSFSIQARLLEPRPPLVTRLCRRVLRIRNCSAPRFQSFVLGRMQPELHLKAQDSILLPVLTHDIPIDRGRMLASGFRRRNSHNSDGQVRKTSPIIHQMLLLPERIRLRKIPARRFWRKFPKSHLSRKYSGTCLPASRDSILAAKSMRTEFGFRSVSG